MVDVKASKSVLDVAIQILYQFMLVAGLFIVGYAIYQIVGGALEAIFIIIPGILTLGGGIVLRKISGINRLASD